MTLPPILAINLATATRRWSHFQRDVTENFSEATLIRMEATDWRALPTNLEELPVTLFTRYLLSLPQQQSTQRKSHRQVDTLSSVAIFMSHMKCWRWLIEHPKESAVLIMEDDACFDGGFRTAWQNTVAPMLSVPQQWDVLVLGYFAVVGPETVTVVPNVQPTVNTKTVPQFFGAHAYLVTQTGARTLLKYALPMDHQVDGLFLTLHELSLLRFHMLRQSVVSQCMDNVNREGSWHTHEVASESTNPTVVLIRGMGTIPISVVLIVLLLIVGLWKWSRCAPCDVNK